MFALYLFLFVLGGVAFLFGLATFVRLIAMLANVKVTVSYGYIAVMSSIASVTLVVGVGLIAAYAPLYLGS